jgi:putative ABC transport system permease protein
MSLLRLTSRRHLTRHPAQLVLSVLGVALGVAVMVAIDLAIQSSREGFRVSAETVAGRATHHLVGGVGGLPDSVFTEVRVGLGIRASAPVVEGYASSPLRPGAALRIIGVDPFSEGPFRPFVAGGGPDLDVSGLVTTPGGVVVTSGTAAAVGRARGDTLPALVGGRRVDLPIIGILDLDERLTRSGLEDVLIMDVSSAQHVLGMPGRLSRIDLRLPEGRDGEVAVDAVRKVVPADARLEAAGVRTAAMSGMIAAFDLNLTALSLLALVFGMFLIYNAMTFSVVQRRELIGSLRALGVTRGEVLSGVLREALWVGGVGAAAGTLLGVALGRGLVRMVTQTINDLYFVTSVQELSLPPEVLAKGVLVGVGATVLAALPPALEAAASPPRVAQTRSLAEGRAGRAVRRAAVGGSCLLVAGAVGLAVPSRSLPLSFAALFLVILGMALLTPAGAVALVGLVRPLVGRSLGILGTMSARGVVTALSRTAPAIAALVVAVSVTVGLGIMIQSFRGTLSRWLDGTLQADVYVSLPSPMASRADGTLGADVVDVLAGHPAVVGFSTYRGVEAPVEGGVQRLVALDLDPRGEAAFDFAAGRSEEAFPAFRHEGAVLVSEPLAYRQGLTVGDTVVVPTPLGARNLPVAGVFYDYGSDQGVVMMSRPTFDALFDDDGVTSLGLFLAEDADGEQVVDELRARVPPDRSLVIRTNATLRGASLEVFDRTFQVTAVLRLLAFAVAFVGVLSALMALELERARELGVLRANGLTPRQVWRLVTTQTGLMGLISGVLAVPMGLVLAAVMIFVVNKRSFGWTLRMEVGPDVVVQAVALALVGALLAGLYPSWKMARTSPAEALRSE